MQVGLIGRSVNACVHINFACHFASIQPMALAQGICNRDMYVHQSVSYHLIMALCLSHTFHDMQDFSLVLLLYMSN